MKRKPKAWKAWALVWDDGTIFSSDETPLGIYATKWQAEEEQPEAWSDGKSSIVPVEIRERPQRSKKP